MSGGAPGDFAPDQRIDNGMAMVFDSDVLGAPLDILGYPNLEIELSSDKKQAMLFAAIFDVASDGKAARISYGVMNLTHLQGHDKVAPLQPGKKVKVYLKLDCCGHRFAAGHRVRLSLATSYWPMFWPMPEDAALTLDLTKARLTVPIFTGQNCQGPDMQPKSAPPTPVTWLEESCIERTATYDVISDTWSHVTDGVGGSKGAYRYDEIDSFVKHTIKRELTLSDASPLSAHYTVSQSMRLGREGWWTDTDIVITQTSDLENFYITGKMETRENEQSVLEKKWDYKVQRNGL